MDVKRFGTTVALSCFIVASYPALGNASGQGRGGGPAAGSHGGGRGTTGGASGQAQGRAPRGGTVIRSKPPAAARPDSADGRAVTGWPVQAVALESPPDPNPRDSAEADAAPAPPKASVPSESSSIQPMLLSPLPQTSPSSPRGALRLELDRQARSCTSTVSTPAPSRKRTGPRRA